jgi:hypothetical protein
MNHERMKGCIDACIKCALECENCVTACLHENEIAMMTRCIQLDRECAEACYASARLMSLGGEHATLFCQACAEMCDVCAEECDKHGKNGMEHCRRCAEACRTCAEECRAMAGVNA